MRVNLKRSILHLKSCRNNTDSKNKIVKTETKKNILVGLIKAQLCLENIKKL